MPKNTKRGKNSKNKKQGDDEGDKVNAPVKNDKFGQQEYAQVTKMLGNGRLLATLFDEQKNERLCIIPGSMRKRKRTNMINRDDIILVSIRDFQVDKCDVIYKYNSREVRQLIKDGELPSNLTIATTQNEEEQEDQLFEFVDDEGSIDLEDI